MAILAFFDNVLVMKNMLGIKFCNYYFFREIDFTKKNLKFFYLFFWYFSDMYLKKIKPGYFDGCNPIWSDLDKGGIVEQS